MPNVTIDGALGNLIDVYAGPTQDGQGQVIVTLTTSDTDGEGRAKSVVNIAGDADDPSLKERIAAQVHEQAIALMAHELLEQIRVDGDPVFDAHAGGRFECSPPFPPDQFREIKRTLGMVYCQLVSVVGRDGVRRDRPIVPTRRDGPEDLAAEVAAEVKSLVGSAAQIGGHVMLPARSLRDLVQRIKFAEADADHQRTMLAREVKAHNSTLSDLLP